MAKNPENHVNDTEKSPRDVRRHLICCGGGGESSFHTSLQLRDSLALFSTLPDRSEGSLEKLSGCYETMDAGGEFLRKILKILALDKELNFADSSTLLAFLAVAARVRSKLKEGSEFNLMMTAPEWFKNQLLLTKEQLEFDLGKGYKRDLILGSLVVGLALEAAEGTKEDKSGGFEAIINEVIDSNGAYEVRAALVGTGWGGEGRINLCRYPAILKEKCRSAVMENLHMTESQAADYVDRTLKIGVIMFGTPYRFPRIDGLDQDIAGLVSGTLENYPQDSAEALDAFYLIDNDQMPVQADRASEGNEQYKHSHAAELVAYAAMEDFFHRTQEDFDRLKNAPGDPADKAPILPWYSLPGHGRADWANLRLPDEYRLSLSARLRFDAVLFYWLYPQLIFNSDDTDQLYESEFLCRMYGAVSAKKLSRKVNLNTLIEEIVTPFKALLARETLFLEFLKDISQTGRDWERRENPSEDLKADLFPTEEIDKLLSHADIKKNGGLTGFCLDQLTRCRNSDNLFHTDLTIDRVRTELKYARSNNTALFMDTMKNLYALCAERKEK